MTNDSFDRSISDSLHSTTHLEYKEGQAHIIEDDFNAADWAYKKSPFQSTDENDQLYITQVTFRLKPAEAEEKDPLEAAQEEIAKLKEQMLYKAAEFDNYRKRTIKEKADLLLNGAKKTVLAVLPVMDDMERAIAEGKKTDDPEVIRQGMELIYQKFIKALEGLGVKAIDTKDQDFNVDMHEAIAMVPGMGDDKKGKVIDCVLTGYTLNDEVIRYAKVAVGQ